MHRTIQLHAVYSPADKKKKEYAILLVPIGSFSQRHIFPKRDGCQIMGARMCARDEQNSHGIVQASRISPILLA